MRQRGQSKQGDWERETKKKKKKKYRQEVVGRVLGELEGGL